MATRIQCPVNRGSHTEPEKEEQRESRDLNKDCEMTGGTTQAVCNWKIVGGAFAVLIFAVWISSVMDIPRWRTTDCDERSKKMLSNIGVPDGATPYLLTSQTSRVILHCIHLEYDKEKVNQAEAKVDNRGYLVNRPESVPWGHKEDRFGEYCGTCSNAPLPQSVWPIYWEVRVRVRIDKPLPVNHLVLQIGLCRKEHRDLGDTLPKRPHIYWLEVSRCSSHNSICVRTVKGGYEADVVHDVLSNTPGSISTLHYGILYDESREKMYFIDVNESKIISVFKNIDTSKTHWPMFGVYNRYFVNVEMKLVVQKDIEMAGEKKQTIFKGLMQEYVRFESGSAYGE